MASGDAIEKRLEHASTAADEKIAEMARSAIVVPLPRLRPMPAARQPMSECSDLEREREKERRVLIPICFGLGVRNKNITLEGVRGVIIWDRIVRGLQRPGVGSHNWDTAAPTVRLSARTIDHRGVMWTTRDTARLHAGNGVAGRERSNAGHNDGS